MRYKNLGHTLSFRYPESEKLQKECDILTTYSKSDIPEKYNLEIKLRKTVCAGGQEFNFEHIIDKQTIPSRDTNVRRNVVMIVNYALAKGLFRKHLDSFNSEIRSSLYIK